jgi:hypothetical protein
MPSLWGGFAACGWPVDALMRFWGYLGGHRHAYGHAKGRSELRRISRLNVGHASHGMNEDTPPLVGNRTETSRCT